MKLIIEIESDDELQKVQGLIKELPIHYASISSSRNLNSFFDWCNKNAKFVDNINIPSREERNER